MRFIIDASLSPRLRDLLREAGHDAVHVVDYDMLAAPDADILVRGRQESRIVVTADSDFSALLVTRGESSPSLILIRYPIVMTSAQFDWIQTCIEDYAESLETGSILVISRGAIRVRKLPVTAEGDTPP